jgi:hypothetical protein
VIPLSFFTSCSLSKKNPAQSLAICLRIPRQFIVLKQCLMPAAPSSYSPFGVTVFTGQMIDPLGSRRAVDLLPHRFLIPTDSGYPLTAVSTGENLRQVWNVTSAYNITVTCPSSPTLHCCTVSLSSWHARARSAGSSEAALAPTRNADAPDNLCR